MRRLNSERGRGAYKDHDRTYVSEMTVETPQTKCHQLVTRLCLAVACSGLQWLADGKKNVLINNYFYNLDNFLAGAFFCSEALLKPLYTAAVLGKV